MLISIDKLNAHGWDYHLPEESGSGFLSESSMTIELLITSFIFLILSLIRIYSKSIKYKKAKLFSNLALVSYVIYVAFVSECALLEVMVLALGLFFFFGFTIMLLIALYVIIVVFLKAIKKLANG